MRYIVHKFGGSSLADEKKVNNIVNIVSGKNEVIVVSATGKTTSKLKQSLSLAKTNKNYMPILQDILKSHFDIIDTFSHCHNQALKDEIAADIKDISRILTTIVLTKTYADSLKNFVLGYGELWSAKILTHCLQCSGVDAGFVDASKVLHVDDTNFPVSVNWSKSQTMLHEHMLEYKHDVYVITGFIAQNTEGHRTILGMNCSDYSAAIFAKLTNASELNIWTDVAGIFSANPQAVPNAKSLDSLSYKEALELAYFGASVVHPLTISPMMEKGTPIYIKSSFDPAAKGTVIRDEKDIESTSLAKGVSSITNVAMLRVQGAGMIGVSGISARVFNTLERAKISVLMISQASSEYSICFAIPIVESNRAVKVLEKEFLNDIRSGNIEHVRCDKPYALVTAVGDGMIAHPGSLAKMINALAEANINIHAIAQGSSERSITVTIKEEKEALALSVVHDAYYA